MEYDHEEEYKRRMEKWGMHTKEGEDATIDDCLSDFDALRKAHGDRIKGVIIIPLYDFLDMNILNKEMETMEYMDKPPTNSYLCSGGMSMVEGLGALELAKSKIFYESQQ